MAETTAARSKTDSSGPSPRLGRSKPAASEDPAARPARSDDRAPKEASHPKDGKAAADAGDGKAGKGGKDGKRSRDDKDEVLNLAVATAELLEIADFGPPPESILGVPGYALRVRRRHEKMRAELAGIHVRLGKAELRRVRAEAQVGQAAVDQGLVAGEDAEKLSTKFRQAEQAMAAAKSRSSKEAQRHADAIRRLAEQEDVIKSAIEALSERERQLADQVRDAETSRRRSEARLQRALIELRNADAIIARGGTASVDAMTRREEVRKQMRPLEDEALKAAADEAGLRLEYNGIRREIDPARNQLDAIDDERDRLVDDYEEGLGLRSEETRRASTWRRSQLAAIGREVFDGPKRARLSGGERACTEVEMTRAGEADVLRDLDRHLRAFDVYDRDAVGRAKVLLIVAAGLGVITLLTVVLSLLR